MSFYNKKIMIIGVPLDLGSEPLGVEIGASALRYAGIVDALKYNGYEVTDLGDLHINKNDANKNFSLQIDEIKRVSEILSDKVYNAMKNDYIPIILGGDHSAAIGSIAGASRNFHNLGLIWIDCHPDSNTPETSPTGNIHGMTVAISLGFGYEKLTGISSIAPKVRKENVLMIGINDIDQGEKIFLERNKIKYYTMLDIDKIGISKIVNEAKNTIFKDCEGVHISLDIDALDPLIAPGTGILSRGGLSYREISYIATELSKEKKFCSIDVIEINPLLDIKNQTSELAVEIVLKLLGGNFGDYERKYLKKVRN